MRITRSADRITLRDRPGSSWGLGLFLLSGGVLMSRAYGNRQSGQQDG
ncbi:MAG: hypothetical protein ACJ8DJ_17840 [Gemmatimonadales bacterium]